MKITKLIENCVENAPQELYIFKRKYSEELAILKKKKLYKDVNWSIEQKTQFDDFWEKNYGKKIRPWWTKMYEGFNGVYRYDYFPEMIYITQLEPLLNPMNYCKYIEDKSFINLLFGSVDGVRIPQTYITCCNGAYRDSENVLKSEAEVIEKLSNIGECVIKPTVDTGSGKGVGFFCFNEGFDNSKKQTIEETIKKYGKNFIVQQSVANNKELRTLNPSSLNTFRIISYLVDNEVKIAPMTVRIGSGDNKLDNIHSGGFAIGVNTDGLLKEYAYQLGYCNKSIKCKSHPKTNVVFKEYHVGDVKKIREAAKKLHSCVPYVGIISWDLTLDENDEVVLIEANCHDQGIWFPQIVNGESFFSENTAFILNKLRDRH